MAAVSTIIAVAFTAVSIVYQVEQQRKAKKAAEAARRAAEEARKGFEIAVEGQSISLPVVYGRGYIAGARVYHNINNNYTHVDAPSNTIVFQSNLDSSRTGEKNEYLFVQQAVCYGPIHNVIDWRLDDQESDTEELKFGQRIVFFKNGSQADPMMSANFSERTNSTFPDCAYASMVFRLNRDESQYGGAPDVGFYIEGKLVRPINKSGSTYSLGSYTYSNNPAWCLLDYLIDTKYGRGLSLDSIDLESFWNAAQVCGTTVQQNVSVNGRIWQSRNITQRNLPLYECNITVDTERPIRDNIVEILGTMGDADLVWSGGKYKLQLQYPQGLGDIILAGTITDDDIVRSSLTVEYPSANDRMNHCIIKFSDEALNFKDNTAAWPPKGSTVYNTFLQQDNNIPLENSFTEPGIVDYYHALAKAEELARLSRTNVTYSFKVNMSNTFYEPGDIIFINSLVAAINNEYLKIKEVKVNSDSTADITAVKFDPAQLAWNAKDDQIVPIRNNYEFQILPPLRDSITFTPASPNAVTGGLGILSWLPSPNQLPASYIIEYKKSPSSTFISLGTSSSTSFEIFSLEKGDYQFAVRARSTLGQLSERILSPLIFIDDGTSFPPILSLSDEIVLTAGKVITNIYITVLSPTISGFILGYESDIRLQGTTNWISLGRSANTRFEYQNVIDGRVYEIRSRVINKIGNSSSYSFSTHNVVGKLAPPSNVSNFTACSCRDGIRLTWSAIPDLDRDLYEIRTGVSWLNSELIIRTKETEFIIERPLAGLKTFYIKAIDTSGNYSLSESTAIITVNSPGNLTGQASIVGEDYLLQWNEPTSIQQIEEYIIKENDIEITRIKGTSYRAKVQGVGLKTFSITAVDLAGNLSSPLQLQLNISISPATIIQTQVVDNNVLLYWIPVKGTLPTIGYEIRKGNTLSTSSLIGFLNGEFSSVFETIAGNYTYWVIPKDSAGNFGNASSVTASVSQPPDYIFAVDYFSDFSGTRVNTVDAAGTGILFPFSTTRTWDSQFTTNSWTSIQSAIDSSYSIYIQPALTTGYYEEVYDYQQQVSVMKVKVIPTIEIIEGSPTYKIDISLSSDGINYTDYLNTSEIFGSNFRYVKFRITATATTDKDILLVSSINLVLDAKQKTDSGTISALASDTGGTTVNFTQTFLDITSINISANSTTPVFAIYDFVDVPNPTFFKILVFNSSGQRVNAEVSWTARGY
jgi:hypothetical protein